MSSLDEMIRSALDMNDPALLEDLMPVRIHDKILDEEVTEELRKHIIDRGFKFGWNSNSEIEYGHWNTFFAGKSKKNRKPVDDELTGIVKTVVDQIKDAVLPKESQVIRCYSNAYSFGTEGYPHTDSQIDSDMTVVVYLNKNWKPEWAGETVFFDSDDEIHTAVLPKFGRIVVFPSAMLHVARSVSRICSELRLVFVLKVRTE